MTEELPAEQSKCDKLLDDNAILYACLDCLVDLKDHKDKHGKDEYYLTNQPKAWEYARQVLKDVME